VASCAAEYGASPREPKSLCDNWGYRIRRYEPAKKELVEVEESFCDAEYANMVLMPREKL
jgi:hypothetical protein